MTESSQVGRRHVLAAAATAAGIAAATRGAGAQGTGAATATPPVRAARTVVGFPPGGSSDVVARLYAERLRGTYAQQLIVDSRPGAGGRIAIEHVKASPPDGATILQTPASMLTIYPHLYRSLRYDPLTDFIPVTTVCVFPFGFAVKADHPARTFPDFLVWARARGGIDWASPAPGSAPHFVGVQLSRVTGIPMNHIPYRSGAPMLQDLIAGTIHAAFGVLGEQTPLAAGGQIRILAVSSPERLPRLPQITTLAELGYRDLTAEEWFGVLLPAGTPAPLVQALHAAIGAAAAAAEMREALARLEYAPAMMEPAAFAARIRSEQAKWGPIVAASGFRPEE
jgi:tripartite-type tricarboxylate transporter receptor subunit TctC